MPPRLVEMPSAPSAAPPSREEETLLSAETGESVSASFRSLASARANVPGPEAMEAMARELLRPMLKQWLDDNLPPIVERLVRAEIERVARGPR